MATTDVQIVDIFITQGDCGSWLFTFTDTLTGDDIDVSAWEFSAQIRDLYDSAAVLLDFSFSSVGLDNNQVLMSATAADTMDLPISEGTNPGGFNVTRASYDVKAVVDDGCQYTIQRGVVFVTPTVTK
jgi:hypothetical protein